MQVKFLQSVITAIGSFEAGDVKTIEDEYTVENWVEQGIVERVKSPRARKAAETE